MKEELGLTLIKMNNSESIRYELHSSIIESEGRKMKPMNILNKLNELSMNNTEIKSKLGGIIPVGYSVGKITNNTVNIVKDGEKEQKLVIGISGTKFYLKDEPGILYDSEIGSERYQLECKLEDILDDNKYFTVCFVEDTGNAESGPNIQWYIANFKAESKEKALEKAKKFDSDFGISYIKEITKEEYNNSFDSDEDKKDWENKVG